jgi:hypothetical protein
MIAVTRSDDTARALRDAALRILKARGRFRVDDGVCSYSYRDENIRICHEPAIAGADMPSVIDIWQTGIPSPAMTVYWFTDGRFDVISHLAGLPWEDTLRHLAAMAPAESAGRHTQTGHNPSATGT